MELKYNTLLSMNILEFEDLVVSGQTVFNILWFTVESVLDRRIKFIAILKLDAYNRFLVEMVQF
jgi:hypothetical protein